MQNWTRTDAPPAPLIDIVDRIIDIANDIHALVGVRPYTFASVNEKIIELNRRFDRLSIDEDDYILSQFIRVGEIDSFRSLNLKLFVVMRNKLLTAYRALYGRPLENKRFMIASEIK